MKFDPYSATVREFFNAPEHAGALADNFEEKRVGYSAESGDGACVELAAGLRDGKAAALRYRVFGCPHLVAAAEWACRLYEGQPLQRLSAFSVQECLQALDAPLEKTGRVLLLEDAIHSLLKATDSSP